MAHCVSSLLTTAVLGFPAQCELLPWLAAFQPIDDGHPWISRIARLTFVQAVVVIFKHATFLRLKGLSSESSLTQAELDYREANIDLKIQEHLTGSSQDSVELSASFIMATHIEPSRSSVKEHRFKRLSKPAFPRKS
ncbi:hypothetical protein EDB84DRAFT_1583090 [Lactarius hengduanensis]|nr:hypothetical protein EDB84DRAFT_1583090 [Lactarius hengduanensis]